MQLNPEVPQVAQPPQAGRLICLASRNASPEDVLQVFMERPCAVKLEQIVAWEIHLGSKAESLQRLSEKLNISLDSFVFLDDNSFEVEDVSRSLPDVLVIHVPGNLGNEDELTRSLQHCWVLDAFTGKVVTKEDQQRTQLYPIESVIGTNQSIQHDPVSLKRT